MEKQRANTPSSNDASKALGRLKEASKTLKEKIEQAKRRNDMPVDSSLGDPDWEKRAADGHLDIHENDDE